MLTVIYVLLLAMAIPYTAGRKLQEKLLRKTEKSIPPPMAAGQEVGEMKDERKGEAILRTDMREITKLFGEACFSAALTELR